MASIVIYTDGACLGNPGPGGWGAIVRLADGTVVELGGGESSTTNNRMELVACLEGIRYARSKGVTKEPVEVLADSKYVLEGISKWIHGWKQKNWITKNSEEVKNRDLWEALDRSAGEMNITWTHVEGHAGIPGNERCDEISVQFAEGSEPYLYDGPATEYSIDLNQREPNPAKLKAKQNRKSSSKPKGPGTFYLSYVGGKVYRDPTWPLCEARVKGHRGAKYKKCGSADEEREILTSWGVKDA